MMLEGEILTDSELLLEEGEELEDWEQGEIADIMEEEELATKVMEGSEPDAVAVLESNTGDEETADIGKVPKKKGAKVGAGGTSKKRFGHGFVSPRKQLLAKAVAKAGENGAKKGCNKP
ncbi:Uncharacterized protein Rs2_35522 [Raphanus sativus]|nr:Uncharacterized protein Rs2_35522 [Raphanus sativus]